MATTPIGQLPNNELISTISGNIRIGGASGFTDLTTTSIINANISGASNGSVRRVFAIQNHPQTISNTTAEQDLITGSSLGSFTYAAGAMNSPYQGIRLKGNGQIQMTSQGTFGLRPYIGSSGIGGTQSTPSVTISSLTPFDIEMEYICLQTDSGSGPRGTASMYFRAIIYSNTIMTLSNYYSAPGYIFTSGQNIRLTGQFSVADPTNIVTLNVMTAEYY